MKMYGLLNEKGGNFNSGNPTVIIDDNGTEHLYSYYTEIMTKHKNGRFYRVWTGWTQTTGRHIKAFSGMTKADFDNTPFEK